MIPSKTVAITTANGMVDILAKYGTLAVAVEAYDGDVTFLTLSEINEQTGVESNSEFLTAGLKDGKIIYGRFSDIRVATNTVLLHIK